MTTYKTGVKYVTVRREMGGDEGEDVERNTVDRNQRVPPLADSRQRGRGVLVELRNRIRSETVPKFRLAWQSCRNGIRDVRWRMHHTLQLFVQSKDELRNREAFAGVSIRVHEGDGCTSDGRSISGKVVTSPECGVPHSAKRYFARCYPTDTQKEEREKGRSCIMSQGFASGSDKD